jgi:hypothetical protein
VRVQLVVGSVVRLARLGWSGLEQVAAVSVHWAVLVLVCWVAAQLVCWGLGCWVGLARGLLARSGRLAAPPPLPTTPQESGQSGLSWLASVSGKLGFVNLSFVSKPLCFSQMLAARTFFCWVFL